MFTNLFRALFALTMNCIGLIALTMSSELEMINAMDLHDMPHLTSGRRDFFISFNSADREWAEWIAYELEQAGYTTFFQHWDFSPGSNFVLEMQKAASQSDKTIAVLSQDYLDALFTQPEWSAALAQDPTGANRTLIPVRVVPCQPRGILAPIVYCDLTNLSEEAARERLLSTAQGNRPKPEHVSFPGGGNTNPTMKKEFPGAGKPGSPSQKAPKADGSSRPAGRPPTPPLENHGLNTWLPFAWFVLAVLCTFMIIAFGDKLVGFGLVNQIYFVVLVALGLGAAGGLFTGLRRRSIAKYQGQHSFGTLELSGPAVIFVLVVGAGIIYAPSARPFGLTVFVHGPGGPQDLILRNEGRVAIDVGPERRLEQIGEKGSAFFPAIPADYRGKDVPVSVIADGFSRTAESPLHLTGDSLYVPVMKKRVLFSGVIVTEAREPVPNAAVQIAGKQAKTNEAGRFELSIPGELVKKEMTLDVRAEGLVGQTHPVVPNSNEIRLILKRMRR